MNKELLVYSLLSALLLTTFNLTFTNSAAQTGSFQVSVAGTAAGSIPHKIDLKVTQIPGGQLSEVSGFIVSPEDVVQVKQGENLIVSTSPDLRTNKVTVINMQGIPVDLVPLPSNAWSLQGLLPGVYTLNVYVALSTSGILGTYETILVILEPDQQPLPPTTIINQITIRQPDGGCPGNLTLINGTCQSQPPRPGPSPGPCPNSTLVNGKCPTPQPPPLPNTTIPLPNTTIPLSNDTDSLPGLVLPPQNQTQPIRCPLDANGNEVCPPITPLVTPPMTPPGDCPEGTTGTPPDCVPIDCPEGQIGTPPNCEPIAPEEGNGGDDVNGGDDGRDGGDDGSGSDGGDGSGGDGNGGNGNGGDGGSVDIPSLFG
jgi:uncharacterized membrane protein YgcG